MTRWYDFAIENAPVPCVGRLLIRGNPTAGMWDRIRAEAPPITGPDAGVYGATFIILIDDVEKFLSTMPKDMHPPEHGSPFNGLPKNVWVGGRPDLWPAILDVRARVRFLLAVGRELDGILDAWRCRLCGIRGLAPRPTRCPRTNLCGDGTIISQVHWVVDEKSRKSLLDAAHAAKVPYWSPKVSEFPNV